MSLLFSSVSPPSAFAQAKRIIIRDAEIESIIRSFAVPLFRAAGQNPDSVKIRLVKDKSLNAYVSGGRNIFLHTGLIIESSGPDALIGVIAHETGHIEGGHLSRTRGAVAEAGAIQLIGTILGAIAAVGAGRPDVGQALVFGSQSAGRRLFMKYSRTQESAADQAAMRLLDATGRTAKGLEKFLETLNGQSMLTPRLQDPYARTHPLTRQRITTIQNFVRTSPNSDHTASPAEVFAHARMVAKLYGYIEPFHKVMKRYPESDTSFAARYARAIAYYRRPDLKHALKIINSLIKEAPHDPYLYELKGQMLFEHARPKAALVAYQKAYQYAPNEQLIVLELARVELETNEKSLLDSAIKHFQLAIRMGASSAFTWRQLGIAYGRKGDLGWSNLALAEAEMRIGQFPNAEYLANKALNAFPKGTSAHIRAQDILQSIKVIQAAKAAQ